jgi:hypothetical protein
VLPQVRMGFGLHVGWAIEGAIGSEYKIDASYLSPNVNMASRLEAATKQFGTSLLLSEDFVRILSPPVSCPFAAFDPLPCDERCEWPPTGDRDTHAHAHMHLLAYICMHACTHTAHMHMQTCTHTPAHIDTRVSTNADTCAHAHIFERIHTYTHKCAQTHIPPRKCIHVERQRN